uniref:Uncharacterized protein n=1 Tax=Micrurus surinamensis TaxID=129470 RepID=A0A2D4PEY1_MICSU
MRTISNMLLMSLWKQMKGLPLNWVRIPLNMHWEYTNTVKTLENKMLFKNYYFIPALLHMTILAFGVMLCRCMWMFCVLTKPLQTYCKGETGGFQEVLMLHWIGKIV